MKQLTKKLQKLSINQKFSINIITKLIKQHEDQKNKSKQLAAKKSVNYQQTAKMIWVKNNKDLVAQFKISLGAVPFLITKVVKRNPKT